MDGAMQGDGDDATYLFSSSGTAQNQKQRNLIDSINKKYGGNIVKLKTTSSGMNSKVTIDVHPIAEKEFNIVNSVDYYLRFWKIRELFFEFFRCRI